MPHQHQDVLLPGESLLPGEFLLSADGRFRLYLEEDGALVAFAYRPNGIVRMWRSISAGPNARAELGPVRYPGHSYNAPALLLKNQSGGVVWYASDQSFSAPVWENHFFAMQSDGNIVHYARASTTGLTKATWASGTWERWNREVAIPPNTLVVKVPPPGTVIIQPGVGDGDIVNNTGAQIAVLSGTTCIAIAASGRISLIIPETLDIEPTTYQFRNLRAPDGTPPNTSEADALQGILVPRPSSGQRVTIEVGPGGGLRLRGLFTHPELKSQGEVIISGDPVSTDQDEK